MIICRCDKGHFYDKEQHDMCPICNKILESADTSSADIMYELPIMPQPELLPELPPELSLFKIKKKLGQGTSSKVYEIEQKQTYAVKVISKNRQHAEALAENEYTVAQALMDGKHFTNYYGKYETSDNIFLIQNIQTSWPTYATKNSITERFVFHILQEILFSLITMEQKGYIHLDVKPDNIFVDEYHHGRLGDFSHSRKIPYGKYYSSRIGTSEYMAPEIINNHLYSGKEDMYSFGITMYKMFTQGASPYKQGNKKPAYRSIDDKFITPNTMKKEIASIILKCTAYDPADRYNNLYELLGDFTMLGNKLDILSSNLYGAYEWDKVRTDPTFGLSDVTPSPSSPETYPSSNNAGYTSPVFDAPFDFADNHTASTAPSTQIDEVSFRVFTDQSVSADDEGVIEILMATENFPQHILDEIMDGFESNFKETTSNKKKEISKGQHIKVLLTSATSEGIIIENNEDDAIWSGDYLRFTFFYSVSPDYPKNRIKFFAKIYFDNVIATTLSFFVNFKKDTTIKTKQQIEVERADVKEAFLSYASQDRNRASAILQGIKAARKDLKIFFDLESIRCGEDWEDKINQKLDQSDLLYLCWSHFAKESSWVDFEWRHVFETKGKEAIEPIALEDPSFCPPPDELSEKHFNDILVQFRNAPVTLTENDFW